MVMPVEETTAADTEATVEETDSLFEIVSFGVEDYGYDEGLRGTSKVNMGIRIFDSGERAHSRTEEARTLADAIFKVFKSQLLKAIPELNRIRLVCSEIGMEYRADGLVWPVEVSFNGQLNTVVRAMEIVLKKAILELRKKQ